MQRSMFLLVLATAVLVSCKDTSTTGYKAFDPGSLDSAYKPGDDFFEFVNAKWIAAHPIPADKSRYSTFDALDDLSNATLHQVLMDASAANAPKGSNTQKVGDFWYSGMDTVAIEQAGIEPLRPLLDKIDAIQNTDELIAVAAFMHGMYNFPMFSNWVSQDAMQSSEQILELWQGGLGMPDRDYYFRPDAKSEQLRKDYVQHITNLFVLSGMDSAAANANAAMIMQLETQLAEASMRRVDMRDPYAIYHKMTKEELAKLAPSINWNLYFTELQAPEFSSLNVAQPAFFTRVDSMVQFVPLDNWKAYFRFHLINYAAGYLSSDFVAENFDFYQRKLRGVEEMKPRWKRIVEDANGALGEALGQEYVKIAFSPESKERMMVMIEDLRASLGERIDQLTWMSDSTKLMAHRKLDAITIKIGYPDKWRDYSALEIDRGPYVLNVIRANQFESKRNMNKIGKPVDKTEWGMNPQTVNAYYNPSNNEIVFPAAILQPPFFDPNADDALNYGGIGVVIGHEITHGFDDQGRQFDAEGNLKQWWTNEDDSRFKEKANVVVAQFNGYCPLDSVCIDGMLTLGENIADFGGITVAYNAFKRTAEYKAGKSLDGFTPQQRFFIGFARIWAGDYREESMRSQLLTNPHSPGKWRVNGTLTNVPEWYDAFGIKAGDKLFTPEDKRAMIW